MLIRTQNKEGLIDALAVYIIMIERYPTKTAKIVGCIAGQNEITGKYFLLGEYPNKELATEEIDNIMQFFIENPSGIYQMK